MFGGLQPIISPHGHQLQVKLSSLQCVTALTSLTALSATECLPVASPLEQRQNIYRSADAAETCGDHLIQTTFSKSDRGDI